MKLTLYWVYTTPWTVQHGKYPQTGTLELTIAIGSESFVIEMVMSLCSISTTTTWLVPLHLRSNAFRSYKHCLSTTTRCPALLYHNYATSRICNTCKLVSLGLLVNSHLVSVTWLICSTSTWKTTFLLVLFRLEYLVWPFWRKCTSIAILSAEQSQLDLTLSSTSLSFVSSATQNLTALLHFQLELTLSTFVVIISAATVLSHQPTAQPR
jgi:hypothetical protein